MYYLFIDGMPSGTGIRDAITGGYVNPSTLKLSDNLVEKINQWVRQYEQAHYGDFADKEQIEVLDREGMEICRQLRNELPPSKIEYYSAAHLRRLDC